MEALGRLVACRLVKYREQEREVVVDLVGKYSGAGGRVGSYLIGAPKRDILRVSQRPTASGFQEGKGMHPKSFEGNSFYSYNDMEYLLPWFSCPIRRKTMDMDELYKLTAQHRGLAC